MKSELKNIKIKYWTFPDGTDLKGIETFIDEVDSDYFLTVTKKRTDALGGGLYDLIIEISEDLSLIELAKSYLEDGVKLYIGYHAKTIYNSVKKLFESNEELRPSIEKISIKYKDCKVIFYETYENGIEENFENVIYQLFDFANSNKKWFKKIKQIHVPIFKHKDEYDLCEYRVKLNVDENITEFKSEDYTSFWGIQTKKKKYVYDVERKKKIKEEFYTQNGYDKLFQEMM